MVRKSKPWGRRIGCQIYRPIQEVFCGLPSVPDCPQSRRRAPKSIAYIIHRRSGRSCILEQDYVLVRRVRTSAAVTPDFPPRGITPVVMDAAIANSFQGTRERRQAGKEQLAKECRAVQSACCRCGVFCCNDARPAKSEDQASPTKSVCLCHFQPAFQCRPLKLPIPLLPN